MKQRGMWADFTEEDIELMLAIRREEEARAAKAAKKSSRPRRTAKPHAVQTAPDPKASSKETRTKP
jgi:hypothetical protein